MREAQVPWIQGCESSPRVDKVVNLALSNIHAPLHIACSSRQGGRSGQPVVWTVYCIPSNGQEAWYNLLHPHFRDSL